MKAVLLDADTLGNWQGSAGDNGFVDLSLLAKLFDEFAIYPLTSPDEIINHCQDAQVVITNKVVLGRAILSQLPQLKLIQLTATGMNNIDLDACEEFGITALNVADYSTFPVAQLTLQFILNFATRTIEHNQLAKSGAWQSSRIFTLTDYPTIEVEGKNLLLIGRGSIGKKVAQLAEAFGMTVNFAQLPDRPLRENQVALEKAIPKADFISLHCPLSSATENLVNAQFIGKMKPTAYLINTARGPIINEQDLALALKSNAIAGAALDVLSQEPPTMDNPLLKEPMTNLVMTPHIAWASQEAKNRLIDKIITNIKRFI